jgi:ribonuclease BN (tRNA processing enzyme)
LVIDFRVLGCSGGELHGHRTTSFLLDGKIALDAGSICEALSLPEILRIDHIVLSHSHFDHVKGIPMLADLLIGRREEPVVVHGSPECVETLRRDVFNEKLWPDFTRLPNKGQAVIRLEAFEIGQTWELGPYQITSQLVNHPVEAVGLVVEKGRSALAMSGDTGPTDAFWKLVNGRKNLKALLLETSFPDSMHELAEASGHLTPRTLRAEIEQKLERNGFPIHLYHLKPAFQKQLEKEIKALGLPRLRILEADQELQL